MSHSPIIISLHTTTIIIAAAMQLQWMQVDQVVLHSDSKWISKSHEEMHSIMVGARGTTLDDEQ